MGTRCDLGARSYVPLAMDLEQKIVSFLREKYNPLAIVLHGSRANGNAKENSDWDIYLFLGEARELPQLQFEEQNLDIHAVAIDIAEDKISDEFCNTLESHRILFDSTAGKLDWIIQIALAKALAGYSMSEDRKLSKINYSRRLLARLERYSASPETHMHFFNYVCVVYEVSLNYWYQFKGEWPRPIYKALPDIAQRDPEAFGFLKILSSNDSDADKLAASRGLLEKIIGVEL